MIFATNLHLGSGYNVVTKNEVASGKHRYHIYNSHHHINILSGLVKIVWLVLRKCISVRFTGPTFNKFFLLLRPMSSERKQTLKTITIYFVKTICHDMLVK